MAHKRGMDLYRIHTKLLIACLRAGSVFLPTSKADPFRSHAARFLSTPFGVREFPYTVKSSALRDHSHYHDYKYVPSKSEYSWGKVYISKQMNLINCMKTTCPERPHFCHIYEAVHLLRLVPLYDFLFVVIINWHRSYSTPFWDIIEWYWVSNISSLELGLLRSLKLLSDYAAELIWLPTSVKL